MKFRYYLSSLKYILVISDVLNCSRLTKCFPLRRFVELLPKLSCDDADAFSTEMRFPNRIKYLVFF